MNVEFLNEETKQLGIFTSIHWTNREARERFDQMTKDAVIADPKFKEILEKRVQTPVDHEILSNAIHYAGVKEATSLLETALLTA